MLNTIKIEGLFGHYDYMVDLKSDLPGVPDRIRFITGPNGMGKSTILRCIHALYIGQISYFLIPPFQTMHFDFDTCVVTLRQTRVYADVEESSDMPAEYTTKVICSFETKGNSPIKEEGEWILDKGRLGKPKNEMPNMKMYFTTERCLFLSDDRASLNQDDNTVVDPNILKKFVNTLQGNISANFVPAGSAVAGTLKERQDRVMDVLRDLADCEIKLPADIAPFEKGPMPKHFLECYEGVIAACHVDIELLRSFYRFIKDSMFMNKEFRISPRYGYRIYDNGEKHEILTYNNLSLGEKNIFCLAYSMYFSLIPYTMVLIDEPEQSFHLMWQSQFFENIRNVAEIRKASFLVSTHSTEIFDNRFEMVTDLYGLYKKSL